MYGLPDRGRTWALTGGAEGVRLRNPQGGRESKGVSLRTPALPCTGRGLELERVRACQRAAQRIRLSRLGFRPLRTNALRFRPSGAFFEGQPLLPTGGLWALSRTPTNQRFRTPTNQRFRNQRFRTPTNQRFRNQRFRSPNQRNDGDDSRAQPRRVVTQAHPFTPADSGRCNVRVVVAAV